MPARAVDHVLGFDAYTDFHRRGAHEVHRRLARDEIADVNGSLSDEPEKVNKDPYGDGWMIKMKMSAAGEVDSLLTAAEYEDFTKAEE